MAFEREKRINTVMTVVGGLLALSGLMVYFMEMKVAGIVLMVFGAAILMISWTISGLFFKLRMREDIDAAKSKKK